MQSQIEHRLGQFQVDYLGTTLGASNAPTSVRMDDNIARIEIQLGFPVKQYQHDLMQRIAAYLKVHFPELQSDISITSTIEPKVIFSQIAPHPEIKNIIAVASGKGGVGKSTTSVNLAAALTSDGARVGILDADIYGPNQAHMLGKPQRALVHENKRFEPVMCFGMQAISMAYLVDITTPMVWRGPMVSGALQQLFFDTNWSDLDYLVIDLPPGTGDVQLTLSKKIPVTAAVVVTTPQDIALLDARKAVEMFKKVSVPVFGLIENMAQHTCSQCGHQEAIFGAGGVSSMSEATGVPVLGSLPLDMNIRQQADSGEPIVFANPTSEPSKAYISIARTLSAKLSLQATQKSE